MIKKESKTYDFENFKKTSIKPPSAVDIEIFVLGAILIDEKAFSKAIEIIRPECFFDNRNKIIFEAMISLYESNEPIDSVTLYQELQKMGKIEEIGAAYVSQLTQDIPSTANVDYHVRILMEKWILRQLISTSMDIASAALQGNEDVFDLLDASEAKLFKISEKSIKETFKPMNRIVRETWEMIEAIHQKDIATFAVPTGFYSLDDLLGGFQKSDLIILAARPSMGKTAFAMSVVRYAAVEKNIPVAVFSLEMSDTQLVTRLISSEAGINAHSLRTGKFKSEEGSKVVKSLHKLSSAKIYIDDTPAISVLEVRAKARRLKNEQNIGLIVIDYLQLLSSSIHMESREREISTISRSLKALAKELNIPVVALSQLNRAVESRTDKKPMLSDLRESGSIEQDADVVLFLYRPEVYGITHYTGTNETTAGVAEIIVGKQRNGPIGEAKIGFIKEYARFVNLSSFPNGLPTGDTSGMIEEEYPI